MPFRNASAYNDYDYTGFGSPGAFPFNYDLASNQFISPYGVPLVSPQDSCKLCHRPELYLRPQTYIMIQGRQIHKTKDRILMASLPWR